MTRDHRFDFGELLRRVMRRQRAVTRETPVQPYHSVSIRIDGRACAAAAALAGRRLLAKEAPLLPLPQCDAATCRCGFIHHDDRREEDRRAELARFEGHNHRVGTGRRRKDRESAFEDEYFEYAHRKTRPPGERKP